MTVLEFPNMGRPPRPPGKPPTLPVEVVDESAEAGNEPEKATDPNYRFYSNALRATRTQLGLTQMQLAVKAKVSLGTVHLIESSRQNPSLRSLVTLAEAVDLKVGDLLPQTISNAEKSRRLAMADKLEAELELVRGQLETALDQVKHLTALARQLREDKGE